ncbi:MAG: L-threonylcarbamoyladenylate synthase [Candidatus Andersenbacteria bacterium]|nr:L-threonylcarbamoyladenylate synthase [Candidatus Andersenbacteria bacterium]
MHLISTIEISKAAAIIQQGRLVAFPTSTSYGLAADALQGHALQRLRNLKGRPQDKPFTVFMKPSLYTMHVLLTDLERTVCQEFTGRPLTLLVTPRASLMHIAKNGLVGLRSIDHPLMAQLAAAVDVPLTATSANFSGGPPCYSPPCIRATFLNPLPDNRLGEANPRGASGTTYDLSLGAILDGGELPPRLPTTIARLDGDRVVIIRPGAVTAADINHILRPRESAPAAPL